MTGSSPDAVLAAARRAAQADDAFGADLYRLLARRAGNLVFSPASITAALGTALLGARGRTAAELAAALHLDGPESAGEGLRSLSAGLARLGQGDVTCRAPNTLWVQAGLPLRPEFTAALTGLPATVRDADFSRAAEQARLEINNLIMEQTAGKIADLLAPGTLGPRTRLVLANAVYLKAGWAQPFPAAATAETPFYRDPASTGPASTGPASPDPAGAVSVPMMRLTARLGYRRGVGYQVVTLPYTGGLLAMTVAVPDGPLGPLEETLAAGGVRGLLAGVTPQQVRLALPRFRSTASFSLESSLPLLGVAAAFDHGADFSGLTTAEPLSISAAVHKAYIDVDEHGTEAAAATAVVARAHALAVAGRPPIEVTVDRPFVFAITDTATGLPLFLGRVTNPLAS